ncbi:gliding motility-associated ABC transporter substrate-binding protein GldG [Winogradskyella immobilis]|uniref:Gliding motility-associated ABC transporter substrate-binding protein GldG n=1 Tax=Winogradskyella immobilis TaxID=2816852 RepID=A0ABS8EMW4_9FLAO|nr:gliding motility-associated ABC transporter substrate-binding protein GldG [Winogradskyella immobilis]MCC1484570.1 gliding motility-associated ABC transporter substrate-binding protein GldG [Winogradskyella immobilis]MCG0016662.1 gliding motility-associated ABC transporter substrate-binding protein GldG [Winogradskyella immobilis]
MLKNKTNIKHIVFALIGLVILNLISNTIYKRFDLTKDQRYTLSITTKDIINSVEAPLIIDVFLEGELPSEFRLLQTETKQLIEEFQVLNSLVKVNYINPLEDETTRERNIQELRKSGLEPYINSNKTSGKVTQELIFGWAFASYKGNTQKIPLFKKSLTTDLQTQIANSIQQLEYHFADGFNKITKQKSKKIAILKGNGQLADINIADFLTTIQPYYNIGPFTLDSVASNPQKTLNDLNKYDLIISAKPTKPFSEEEKLVLDQYTMNGGKSIWLTEAMVMDKDSLYNASGSSVTIARDLNLNDFFFQYGVRINQNLVKDLYSAPITLAVGEGNNTQFQPIQWQYSPLATANIENPISNNIDLVKFDFASQIDTLKNNISKTVLLQTSGRSKLEGALQTVSLASVTQQPDEDSYNKAPQNLAVLLEGRFNSVYKNRILPFKVNNFKEAGSATKMVVISDGDVIKNEVSRNRPIQLGFDQFTGRTYGNKEFLLNTVNYLLDDTGLINIRSKNIEIAFLNSDKIESNKLNWQLLNIALPLVLLGVFGFGFNYFRKRKYSK